MPLLPISNLTNIEYSDLYVVGELAEKTDILQYLPSNALCGFFKGVNALLEYQSVKQVKPQRSKTSNEAKDNHDRGFFTFNSYGEAVDIYLNNPKSIRKFNTNDDDIYSDEIGKEVYWGVTGEFLDIGRHLEGDPEPFGNMTGGNPRNRRVSIILNVDWVWSTPSEVINRRAARILRLVDWLESQNIRTCITGVASTGCGHLEVEIKAFEEQVNLNDLAIIGHSDFLRRVMFRFDEYSKTWEGGYGTSTCLTAAYLSKPFESDNANEVCLYIGNEAENVQSIDKVFDTLEKELVEIFNEEFMPPSKAILTESVRGAWGGWPVMPVITPTDITPGTVITWTGTGGFR